MGKTSRRAMTAPLDAGLVEKRKSAAAASGGISSEPIYRSALDLLSSLRAQGALLDFGGGQGHFARLACQTGRFHVVVIADLLEVTTTTGSGLLRVVCDLNGPLPFADGAFDTVVALEIIEHLENPRHVFREISRVLCSGGILILSTPNCESIRSYLSLMIRGYHWAFGPGNYPAHITPLLRWDLTKCAEEAGLEVVGFRYSDHGGIPRIPHIKWQHISRGYLRGRLFSDNVLLAARKPYA